MTRPVPHGWQECKLGEHFAISGGDSAPQDETAFSLDGLPFIRMKTLGSVHRSNCLTQSEERISSEKAKLYGLKVFPAGTIIMPRSGSVYMNHRAILGSDAYLVGHIAALESNPNSINNSFAYQYLCHINMIPYSTKTTGLDSISFKEISNIPLLLPPLPEQEGIAAVLGSVDATIDATKQVIAQTRQLKRAVMQTLLTRGLPGQHTQFKPSPLGTIPADWEVVKLDQLGEKRRPSIRTGPFGSSLKSEHFIDSGRPVITIGSLGESALIEDDFYYISEETALKLKEYEVKAGDIVLSRVADVGRSAIIPEHGIGWIISSNLMRICLDKAKANSAFIYMSIIGSPLLKKQLNDSTSDGGRTIVTSDVIKKIRFLMPPLPEQEAIVGILNTVDARLARETETLTRLQTLKTALMQVLLTGEVRVPVALGVSRPAEYGETSPIAVREIVRQGSR